jgi:hypothetical protein
VVSQDVSAGEEIVLWSGEYSSVMNVKPNFCQELITFTKMFRIQTHQKSNVHHTKGFFSRPNIVMQ